MGMMPALILGGALLALLVARVPIGLSMLLASMAYLLPFGTIPMTVVPQRLWAGLESFPLLAIPFFVLAGSLMNVSGGAERIFAFCLTLVGHLRGGLGHVNVLASMIFAGMSGAATADAAGLGKIEIDSMKRDGYDGEFAAAVTAASSTIGPIIPPSVPLVVYGVMTQVSIWQLFLAGILPGILMGLTMMGVVAYRARQRNYPVRPRASGSLIGREFLNSALALFAPVVILGGIFTGVFTPTEAGVVASAYALMLGFVYRTIRFRDLPAVLKEAMLTTAQITFIVGAAGLFGWTMTYAQVPAALTSMVTELTTNKVVVLILINVVMLAMGCFIDALALLIMMTPVVFPLALAMGIDPVQLGLIMVLNCMIGLVTPPVGICLYIVSDIAKTSIVKVARELTPFYAALILCLAAVTFVPALVTLVPNLIGN
jgi:tripartite ATP-independent transporter DctM subunit